MSRDYRKFAVLNTTGPDGVGVVASITRFLANAGANIECQSGRQLQGIYVTSTWFSSTEDELNAIKTTVATSLREWNPQVIETDRPCPSPPTDDRIRATLSLVCTQDSPAIVKRIAEFLAGKSVDIETLAAATYPAPFQGTPMFMAELRIAIPQRNTLRWLAASLEAWEARYGWDLTLEVDEETPEVGTLVPHCAPFPPLRMFDAAGGHFTEMGGA